ncbi:hypothetical protein GCM10009117_12570 [Gangjinia marincola]|uniref:Uncharacterized protein n=1 Tax=Gangjinia marincola TaxID=578463 RepID=A0ABN1MG10_9FLAO
MRTGDTLSGLSKITATGNLKFKQGKKKEQFNYRDVERLIRGSGDSKDVYVYRVLAGQQPELFKVVREYKDKIYLYAQDVQANSNAMGGTMGGGLNVSVGTSMSYTIMHYYVNKNGNHIVKELGHDHPIFGNGSFKKNLKEFFNDCPELIKMVDNNDFKRVDTPEMVDIYVEECAGKQ